MLKNVQQVSSILIRPVSLINYDVSTLFISSQTMLMFVYAFLWACNINALSTVKIVENIKFCSYLELFRVPERCLCWTSRE